MGVAEREVRGELQCQINPSVVVHMLSLVVEHHLLEGSPTTIVGRQGGERIEHLVDLDSY